MNDKRSRFLADHEHELNYHPTKAHLKPEELYEKLNEAMAAGRENSLAFSKNPRKLSNKTLTIDFGRFNKKGSHAMLAADQRLYKMMESYVSSIQGTPVHDDEEEALEKIRSIHETSLETLKPAMVRRISTRTSTLLSRC